MVRGHETVLPDEAGYAASVRRATLFLGLLYQFMQFVISSTLWAFLGYDPIAIAPITLILMLNGTLMSYAMAVALFRFRGRSILFKLLLGSALALVAAAINASVDLLSHGLIEHGDPGPINWTNVGYTLIYCMALFHGWAFLYIALLANYELRERERRLAVTREEALTAQMRALRYQVNPHFLFNTLNSIAGLIEEGASTTARRMVLSLSSFLRTTLELDPMQDVCLADELALQLGYLNIEGERFSDRMRVKLDIAPGLEQALVPSLILPAIDRKCDQARRGRFDRRGRDRDPGGKARRDAGAFRRKRHGERAAPPGEQTCRDRHRTEECRRPHQGPVPRGRSLHIRPRGTAPVSGSDHHAAAAGLIAALRPTTAGKGRKSGPFCKPLDLADERQSTSAAG
ncbi:MULTISPECIES: sensor histidine kinase [unclassified Ensifer]|uniref:sensor histidine kinase n=1 Tax=unclassified Ensifer TaxID=2633371 RepID=UPI000A47BC40|nr:MULTISPECIES: histidine kinase [unclassified Ensifer]